MPALSSNLGNGLTKLEARALGYLARTVRPGFSPSREELSQAIGLGSRGYRINKILDSLHTKQYIRLEPGRSRAISLLRTANGRRFSFDTVWVPMTGQMVTSKPLPSPDPVGNRVTSEAVELTQGLVRSHKDVFALQVKGSAMVDALVDDGDVVILSATTEARNGDMVAARVTLDGDQAATTLKYYYRENGHVRLQPANPELAPLYCRPEDVVIQGKVVLVIRQMK